MSLQSFLSYLTHERRYSAHTVQSYQKDIEQYTVFLLAQCGLVEISEARHTHVRSWIVHLMQKDYAPKSVNRKLSAVKSLYKFLQRKGEIDSNPASKITGPKIAKRLPQVVRSEEMKRGLDEAEVVDSFNDFRDLLIIKLLYETGMRRSELINLTIHSYQQGRRELRVIGKGNKERILPLSVDLSEWIERYMQLREEAFESAPSELILTGRGRRMYPRFVYNKVRDWISRYASVEKRSPHVLRHSFATHLADGGAELNAIKELLGHASLAATEIYTHNSVERLRKIYSQAHPKGS